MIKVNVKVVINCGSFGKVERKIFFGNWKELRALVAKYKEDGADTVILERAELDSVHNITDLAGILERAWHESEGPGNRKGRCIRQFCTESQWDRKSAPVKDIMSQLSAEAAVDGRPYFVALLKEVM